MGNKGWKNVGKKSRKKWLRFRSDYFQEHEKKCLACEKTGKNIQLHHLHYDNFRNETFEDVVPLCVSCHDLLHQMHGRRDGLERQTWEFIKTRKAQVSVTI